MKKLITKFSACFLMTALLPLSANAEIPVRDDRYSVQIPAQRNHNISPAQRYHRPPPPPPQTNHPYGYSGVTGYGGITVENGKVSGGVYFGGSNNGYHQGYDNGYHDGYYQGRRNGYYIQGGDATTIIINADDIGGEDRYECTLKYRGIKYSARGHFRDIAQSRAIESCSDKGNSASDCRSAGVSCESIW